jgi:hypothetical protein
MQDIQFFLLLLSGSFAWLTASLSSGNGALIFLPVSTLFLPPASIAPVTTLSAFIHDSFLIFKKGNNADPWVLKTTLPFAIAGSAAGVFLFSVSDIRVYTVFLLLFYVLNFSGLALRFKIRRAPIFIAAFVTGYLGVCGISATVKERDENSFYILRFMCGLTMIAGYFMFGILSTEIIVSGFAAGAGALVAMHISDRFSIGITDRVFRMFVNTSLIVCIFIILAGQL